VTALLLAAGVALRGAMLLSPKSFWGDEWFSIDLVRNGWFETLRGAMNDVHPPLYFLALKAATVLFGHVDWAYRFVSFAAGLGLLAAIPALARSLFGRTEARLALFLTALSPYWLQSSNEVRSYSLFAFTAAAGAFLFLQALDRPNRRAYAAYACAAVISVYVEHYAWFWIGAATACLGFRLATGRGRDAAAKLLPWHLGAIGVGFSSFLLAAYQAIYREHVLDLSRVAEYLSPPILVKKLAGIPWHFLCGYRYSMLTAEAIRERASSDPFFWLSAAVAAAGTFLAAAAFLRLRRERFDAFVFVGGALVFPIAFLIVVYPIRLDARYLAFAAPVFFVLAARGVALLPRNARAVFLTAYAAVALGGSITSILAPTDPIHKEDYRALVSRVLEGAEPGEAVFGLEPQAVHYQEALGKRFRADYFPDVYAFVGAPRKAYRTVWAMESVNMHPEVRARQFRELAARLEPAGYAPEGGDERFGGPDALTVLYRFRSKGENRA